MSFPAIYALSANSLTAETFRQAISSLLSGTGVVGSVDLKVTANGTPNMSVNVAPGQCWMAGTLSSTVGFPANLTAQTGYGLPSEFNEQASYYGWLNATENVGLSTADPVNPRIDLIVAYVEDAAYSGSANQGVIGAVSGTPAAGPVAPSAPSSALVLAQVAVPAGATSITAADITDERTSMALQSPLRQNPAGRVYVAAGLSISATAMAAIGGTTLTPSFLTGGMTQLAGTNPGLVAPVSGWYQINGEIFLESASTSNALQCGFAVNGSSSATTGAKVAVPAASVTMGATVSDVAHVAAGGSIVLFGYGPGTQNGGESSGLNYISACLVAQ